MSESSHEQKKQENQDSRERALHATYHIVAVSEKRYGVITLGSWCSIHDQEHGLFRFIPGLERVKHEEALQSVRDLNAGETEEYDYDKS